MADYNELIPRLLTDERLSHLEKLSLLVMTLVGGASGHVQHLTLREIGEHIRPKISAATLSDAIGTLLASGWIEASKPSEKESWDIRVTGPVKRSGKVEVFEHRVKGAKITVTIEED